MINLPWTQYPLYHTVTIFVYYITLINDDGDKNTQHDCSLIIFTPVCNKETFCIIAVLFRTSNYTK